MIHSRINEVKFDKKVEVHFVLVIFKNRRPLGNHNFEQLMLDLAALQTKSKPGSVSASDSEFEKKKLCITNLLILPTHIH